MTSESSAESAAQAAVAHRNAALLAAIAFNDDGLVPAIAQQHDSGEVLMLAWMNRAAIEETLASGAVCYWSRSRQRLWRKGETSGQTQRLVELRVDCDGDTVLLLVDQKGVACHTGRHNCFFRALRGETLTTIADPLVAPESLYHER
jgi:phosphoribosyl-AMP cyclohydrolase